MSVIKKSEEVYQALLTIEQRNRGGVSAKEISAVLSTDRANISRYLNQLYREKRLRKIKGRPVLYRSLKKGKEGAFKSGRSIDQIVGANLSLKKPIQQAKAAILYPPRGLHTLLLGATGVGKSMFAELMHGYAIEAKMIEEQAPFVQFNCADYGDNPQLLLAQLFGVSKGAYTGASKERAGLLKQADGGIILLDEVHRLPAQGQEMLFTYIDKGYFRPLGETEQKITVAVQIIAATTEAPQSYLLNAFIRRIPMTIKLPSLSERGLAERYYLIAAFFKEEAKRVGKRIYINRNSLISLLLYNCPHNIGQLKSDIQLACAKAFLTYKTEDKQYLLVAQSDLPPHVKEGLLKLPEKREQVKLLLQDQGEILHFSDREEQDYARKITPEQTRFFYDFIEEKLNSLRENDLAEDQINQILNIDIESYFQKHLENLSTFNKQEEIKKIVEVEVADTVEQILKLATRKLKRSYDQKIYFGLALHLQKSISRIKNGDKIYHPELNQIRVNYPDEFIAAMEAAKIIDHNFQIETPLDEIGYLSMFLVNNPYQAKDKKRTRVAVLVIMHGSSTASSMVEVANRLVGVNHAIALDMPLNMEPDTIFAAAMAQVDTLKQDCELLLLVDMGSLTNFGEMIAEKTGRKVKTIDMVSTAVVIDVCRKAVLGQEMEQIYQSCREGRLPRKRLVSNKNKENAVVTLCFTGEGAAEKMKELIERELSLPNSFKVISLNILNREHLITTLNQYQEYYHILALVGTVDMIHGDIPFIAAVDLFAGVGLQRLKEIINENNLYSRIKLSLQEHLKQLNSAKLVDSVRRALVRIEGALQLAVPFEVKVGIVLHICFLIEKLKKGAEESVFPGLKGFKAKYFREMELVKTALNELEDFYAIKVGPNELAYICKMYLQNEAGKL